MTIRVLLFFLILFSTVHAQNKPSQKAYKKAIAQFNKGSLEEGFVYLKKSLQADSTNKKALYAAGYYQFQAQRYDTARQAFDKLIRLYPKDTTFYHYRALTHLYTGNYGAAETDLRQALALDATNETAWNDLGYVYYQWQKPAEAAAALEKSLSIRPSRTAWYYKALLAYDANDRKQAAENLQKSLQLDPQYANALRLKANLLAEDRKYAEAAGIYEGLLKSGDIEDNDFADWGMLYYWQKKYDDALHYFSMPENADDPNLQYYTGLAQFRLKKYAEAHQTISQATRQLDSLDEENAPVFYDRAIVRFQANDRPGALRDFFRAVYLLPEITRQRNQAGDTLDLLGNAALLLNRLHTPRQLDSARAAGYQNRVAALLAEDLADARTLDFASQAVKLDTANAESYFLRSQVLYAQANYRDALQDLEKVFALKKNKIGSHEHYWRAMVYTAMEKYSAALPDFDRAISMDGQKPAYHADRALTLGVLGRYEDALHDINQAMKLEEETDKTYLTLIRASLLNDAGQYAQALADCETVLARQPVNAVAYCTRGYAHKGLNHNAQAIADFAKSLQLNPDLDAARTGLDELTEQ